MTSHLVNSPKTHVSRETDYQAHLIVRNDDRDTWIRALDRAREERLTGARLDKYVDGFPSEMHTYRVRSAENTYTVTVTRFSSPLDGLVTTVACTCTAGKNEKVCKHAALAVQLANCWPFQIEPDPDEEEQRVRKIGVNLLVAPKWRT